MTEIQQPGSAAAVAPLRPRPSGRLAAARTIVLAEAPVLFLLGFLYLQQAAALLGLLSFAGAGVLIWGAVRMGHDRPQPGGLDVASNSSKVPWDWTDFLVFVPGAFIASQMLESLALPLADALTKGADAAVRNAVESFLEQPAFYAGLLFNIYVLACLRRGATLRDLGWRRFRWWWVPVAVAAAYAMLYMADALQSLSQRLFPSAQNSQCIAVQHEYGHFVALAIIVVCVVAPLAEETIFRGFLYGWLKRWLPVGVAVPVSAAIFSALHGVLLLFIPLFAVGCVLAVVFQASRSLWPGALVHALFNLPGILAILSAPTC